MSCMVPVNSKVALERAWEALLRRREEKMALTPFKLVVPMHRRGVVCNGYDDFWAARLATVVSGIA